MMVVIVGGLVMIETMVAIAAFYCMLVLGAEADERNERLFERMQRERHAQQIGASVACPVSSTCR